MRSYLLSLCVLVGALGVLAAAPANDLCADAEVISFGTTEGTFAEATIDATEMIDPCDPDGAGEPAEVSADTWYNFVAPCSTKVTIGTCTDPVNTDTVIAVYEGCDCDFETNPYKVCNDEYDEGTGSCLLVMGGDAAESSQVTLDVVAGTCYKIRVGLYEDTAIKTDDDTFPLTITNVGASCNPPAPTIAAPWGAGPCDSCPEGADTSANSTQCVACNEQSSRQSGLRLRVVASSATFPQCANIDGCLNNLQCLTCQVGQLTGCQCPDAAGTPINVVCPGYDQDACESSSEKSLLLLLLLLLLLIPLISCCLALLLCCIRRKRAGVPVPMGPPTEFCAAPIGPPATFCAAPTALSASCGPQQLF